MKLNSDMRPYSDMKTSKSKYFTNMFLMLLRHNSMADVKLTKENHNTRWELRSSSPLRIAANQTIDISIRGYL